MVRSQRGSEQLAVYSVFKVVIDEKKPTEREIFAVCRINLLENSDKAVKEICYSRDQDHAMLIAELLCQDEARRNLYGNQSGRC